MSTALQLRRGTTTDNNSFTGLPGEITVDTDKNTLILHDGVKLGGYPVDTSLIGNTSTGFASLGVGTSGGTRTVIIGYNATTAGNGYDSIAIGNLAISTGDSSISLGADANADNYGIAIGNTAIGLGDSVSIGYAASSALKCVSVGELAKAGGSQSVCIGYSASDNGIGLNTIIGANAKQSLLDASGGTALGSNTSVASNATALGSNTVALAAYSNSLGWGARANGFASIAIAASSANGFKSIAIGDSANSGVLSGLYNYNIAIGYNANAAHLNNGNNNIAIGPNSSIINPITTAFIQSSIVIGDSASSSRNSTVVIGRNSTSVGRECVAIGRDSYTNGNGSVSIGYSANSTSSYSVCMGAYCSSAAAYGISIGYNNSSTSSYSLVLGYRSKVTSPKSIAIGYETKAYGTDSIGIGTSVNTGSGSYNVAIGGSTIGTNGVSIGKGSSASSQSVAIGAGAINTLPNSVQLRGGIAIQTSKVTTTPELDFAGVENVFMTGTQPFTAIGNIDIALPVGSVLIPTSAGVICTSSTGVITTQPTIDLFYSVDGITFSPLSSTVTSTNLTGTRQFENINIITNTAATHLRFSISVAASSTLTYEGRVFFKGILLQE